MEERGGFISVVLSLKISEGQHGIIVKSIEFGAR